MSDKLQVEKIQFFMSGLLRVTDVDSTENSESPFSVTCNNDETDKGFCYPNMFAEKLIQPLSKRWPDLTEHIKMEFELEDTDEDKYDDVNFTFIISDKYKKNNDFIIDFIDTLHNNLNIDYEGIRVSPGVN